MTQTPVSHPAALRWPAERFYWAVLEAPGWKHAGLLPEGLRAEFEDEAPEAAEGLHAVCTPLGDGRVLACAAQREQLAALQPGTLALLPAALPAFVDAADGDRVCGALNLLVGPFEPTQIRRARLMRHALAAACIGMCALLAAAGLSRRAAHWEAVADEAAEARDRLVRETVPGSAETPEALAVELARLRQGHAGAARIKPAADAAVALAAVLRGWPTETAAKPQSLIASGSEVTLSVTLEGDPAPFLRSLAPPAGWIAAEPRLSASGGLSRVTLQLTATAMEEP